MKKPWRQLTNFANDARRKLENLVFVAKLAEKFDVSVKQQLKIPLHGQLKIPIKAEILLDTVIETLVDVPLDITLDQTSLQLDQLEVEIDDVLHIKDVVHVNAQLPVESTIKAYQLVDVPITANLPIKLAVPLDQQIRVRGKLRPNLQKFSIPLKKIIRLPVHVPIKQTLPIEAEVTVSLDHTLNVPFEETITLAPGSTLKIALKDIGSGSNTVSSSVTK